VGWSIAAVLSSSVSRRREGLVIRLGSLLICASSVALVLLVADGPVLTIAGALFLQGSGFGLSWAHLTRRLVTSAPAGESAKVSAAVPALQRLGYAIGAALCGTIANQAGLADDAAAPTIANAATWLLVLSVPVVMFGAFWAWRLARDDFSEN
ncbi:MAG: MFS transporter, partial [Alphaproteobacteria bacterium]|nr:MFS transporter [Alphaproteobacteria bacterium]